MAHLPAHARPVCCSMAGLRWTMRCVTERPPQSRCCGLTRVSQRHSQQQANPKSRRRPTHLRRRLPAPPLSDATRRAPSEPLEGSGPSSLHCEPEGEASLKKNLQGACQGWGRRRAEEVPHTTVDQAGRAGGGAGFARDTPASTAAVQRGTVRCRPLLTRTSTCACRQLR